MSLTWLRSTWVLLLGLGLTAACSNDSDSPGPSAGSNAGGSSGAAGGNGTAGKPAGGASAGGNAGQASGGQSNTGGAATGGKPAEGGASAGGDSAGGEGGASGGQPGGEVVEACLDAPLLSETRTEALLFQGAGPLLGIVRRADPDAFGTSGTVPWLPQRFGLEFGSVASCASGEDLDYVGSHHNFDDAMSATIDGKTWIFRQSREDYDKPMFFTLERRAGETLEWGPVNLTLVSCDRIDVEMSCTEMY